jgi:hypothetical protein
VPPGPQFTRERRRQLENFTGPETAAIAQVYYGVIGDILDLLNIEGKRPVQSVRAGIAEMLVGHSGLLFR